MTLELKAVAYQRACKIVDVLHCGERCCVIGDADSGGAYRRATLGSSHSPAIGGMRLPSFNAQCSRIGHSAVGRVEFSAAVVRRGDDGSAGVNTIARRHIGSSFVLEGCSCGRAHADCRFRRHRRVRGGSNKN
jgi:hypothetical protein